MMKYDTQFPQYQNQVFYDKSERTIITIKGNNQAKYRNTSSNDSETFSYNQNMRLNNNKGISNGDSMNSILMRSTHNPQESSKYSDDDNSSLHASTINSKSPTSPHVFHLVRKSSMYAPRVEAPSIENLKVDIYNVGVIMKSKMTGVFDPELLKVEAVAPMGRVIKITGDGRYAAQFNADEIGSWKVAMYYNGKYMDGCHVNVCDPSQVKVQDLKGGFVGKNNTFYVDCTRAGAGDLGVDISHEGRPVKAQISPTTTAAYKMVTFTPHVPGAYEINVHFNRAEVREGDLHFFNPDERKRKAVFFTQVEPNQNYIEVRASCDWEVDYITGKPFICHVTDSSDIAVYGMQEETVCTSLEMIADCTHVGDGRIDAEVLFGGRRYQCKIVRDKPGMYRVQFKPRGSGVYKVWINYEGQPVKGSPFLQEIAELEKPTVRGDGLYKGVLGKPTSFIVDPRGFPGQVSVAVTGPSKSVSVQLEQQPNNTIRAVYLPVERGLHFVHVRIDGRGIKGSPYRPLIVDPGNVRVSGDWRPLLDERGIIPLKVNKEKHLSFDVSEAGQGELAAEVQGPIGKIPVTVDARNYGKHSVIFIPRQEGRHHIHVSWSDYPLTNSPYIGYATYEPELEKQQNVHLVRVPVHPPERYPANSSEFDSSVDGLYPITHGSKPEPHKHIVVIIKPRESTYRPQESTYRPQEATYRPQESTYQPQESTYKPQESTYRSQEPTYKPQEPTFRPQEATYRSQEPTYKPQEPTYRPQEPTYKPQESTYGSQEPTYRPQESIYTPQEASYRLPEIVLSPAKPQTMAEPGHVQISNQKPVNKKPVLLQTLLPDGSTKSQPLSPGGRQKVTLRGKGLKEAEVDKLANFTVDGTRAIPGNPMAFLQSIDDHIPVTSEPVKPGVYKCTYVPRKPGAYLMYINWDDKSLKGSPFKVNIRGADGKPEKIVDKYHPEYSTLGSDLEIKIDPKYSTKGKLKVKCTNPQGKQIPCHLKDNMDGTRSLKITPKVAGRHIVKIKYNGSHIMGSPFAVDIRENQVMGFVRVWGPGIESGIIPSYESTFWVDTSGAGSGEVRVRIVGPKGKEIIEVIWWLSVIFFCVHPEKGGAFLVKLRRSSKTDKIYQCFYDPVEPGLYTIIVQWSGKHVGGSPFMVLLANSARELQHMREDFIENSINEDSSSVITQRISKYEPPQEVSMDDIVFY